jgi:hypothetical protein
MIKSIIIDKSVAKNEGQEDDKKRWPLLHYQLFWLFGNYCENGMKMTIGIM